MKNLISTVEQHFGIKINLIHLVALTIAIVLVLYVCWELILVVIGSGIYFYWHMKEDEKRRHHQQLIRDENNYMEIANFLFHPIRNMNGWLDFKSPQGVKDIMTHPRFVQEGEFVFFSFKLLKLSNDRVDNEKLSFAENALVFNVVDELEATARDNPSFRSHFFDEPILHLHGIKDYGSHFLLLFIIVDRNNYDFVKSRNVYPLHTEESTLPTDEDF